jgi:cytochrome c-type biogenesis protein CcmE
MSLLPKSRKARRRLMVVAAAAPILAMAVGLSLYAMREQVVFFYGPAQVAAAEIPPGRVIRIGGLVQPGSLRKEMGGEVRFTVADNAATTPVIYRGDLPDIFREGQGVVAQGAFDRSGQFQAKQVLAKHDENYMPREVTDALKASGEWRGEGPAPYKSGYAPKADATE